jgi:hypothetical protein
MGREARISNPRRALQIIARGLVKKENIIKIK